MDDPCETAAAGSGTIGLMATRDARQPSSDLFILVIFIVVLIDAVLTAHVRVNFLQDHGYDLFPQRPAVAKRALP